MKKERFVGLIIMTKLVDSTGSSKLAVILQRIGRWDFQNKARLDYPGCCKISAHGKLKEGEDFLQGLLRKSQDEFGNDFAKIIMGDNSSLKEIVYSDTNKTEIRIYSVLVSEDDLKTIRLNPCTGGLDPVIKEEFEGNKGPVKIYSEMNAFGVHPAIIALFEDEITAVRKAFEAYEGPRETPFPSILGVSRVLLLL